MAIAYEPPGDLLEKEHRTLDVQTTYTQNELIGDLLEDEHQQSQEIHANQTTPSVSPMLEVEKSQPADEQLAVEEVSVTVTLVISENQESHSIEQRF